MGKVEVDTLTEHCFEDCGQMDIATKPDGVLGCSKKFICQEGARALYGELLVRYERELHKASMGVAGLKEPAVWEKAIRIIEEYIE